MRFSTHKDLQMDRHIIMFPSLVWGPFFRSLSHTIRIDNTYSAERTQSYIQAQFFSLLFIPGETFRPSLVHTFAPFGILYCENPHCGASHLADGWKESLHINQSGSWDKLRCEILRLAVGTEYM
jgi:hypothetical protein